MNTKCVYCGKFISTYDIQNRIATYCFDPDSDLSAEDSCWICKKCKEKMTHKTKLVIALLALISMWIVLVISSL